MKTDCSRWTKGLNHYSCYISKSRNWKEHHTTARSCWNLSTGDKFDLGCLICQGHNYSVQQQTTFCPIKIWKNKKIWTRSQFHYAYIQQSQTLCSDYSRLILSKFVLKTEFPSFWQFIMNSLKKKQKLVRYWVNSENAKSSLPFNWILIARQF